MSWKVLTRLPLARLRMALSLPVRTSPLLMACCACASSVAASMIARAAAASADSLPKSLLVMCPLNAVSKQRALPHGCGQRSFIEIIEFAADRYAVGKPRYLDTRLLQEVGDVVRGGLAIDGGIQCQDDFAHPRIVRARHQRVDGQILRADAVERRQRSPQHMIEAVGRIGPLQRPEIGDVGDHDDDRGIAPWVGADRAGILGVD